MNEDWIGKMQIPNQDPGEIDIYKKTKDTMNTIVLLVFLK